AEEAADPSRQGRLEAGSDGEAGAEIETEIETETETEAGAEDERGGDRGETWRDGRSRRGASPQGALVGVMALLLCLLPGLCTGPGFDPLAGPSGPTVGPAPRPYPRGDVSFEARVLDAAGMPIEGADLRLLQDDRGPVRLSDAEGRIRLHRLAPGRWLLRVERAGYARVEETLSLPTSGEHMIRLAPGSEIRGRIVDEDAAPLSGVEIIARAPGEETSYPFSTRSDEEGAFALDTLPEGEWELEIRAPGYETIRRLERSRLDGPLELHVMLRRTGRLVGRVYDPDGAPVEGASIALAGSGVWPPRQVETIAGGHFQLAGVPEGVYEVRARYGTLVSPPREGIFVRPGGTVMLTLRLIRGVSIAGRILDQQTSEPVEGAQILVTEEMIGVAPRGARSAEDGTFRIEGLLDRPHRLSVSALGYVARHGELVTPGSPLELRLQRGAVLSGIVVDSLDYPVAGARVEVLGIEDTNVVVLMGAEAAFRDALFDAQLEGPERVESGELGVTLGRVPLIPLLPPAGLAQAAAPLGDPAGAGSQSGRAAPLPPLEAPGGGALTDAEGRFRLVGVPPGRIQLLASHPAHAPGEGDPLQVLAGQEHDDLRLQLPEGATIEGRVVDARGFPVGSVQVELHAEREPMPRSVLAAEDGAFRFTGALGAVTLTALPPDLPAARLRLQLASGEDREVRLELESEIVTLTGRVLDPHGFPIAEARVHLSAGRAAAPIERLAITDPDGSFSLPGLPAPPYRLEADHPTYALLRMPSVTQIEGLELRLEPGGTVRGELLADWDGTPVADAQIQLLEGPELRLSVTSDVEGRFEIRRVPYGDYTLLASRSDLLEARVSLSLRPSRYGEAALELDAIRLGATGGARGQVVDRYGAPVPGARVAAGDPPAWAGAASTDEAGHFVLAGLAPGLTHVHARHPAAGEASSRELRIRPQEELPDLRLELPEALDRPVAGAGRVLTGVAAAVERREGNVVVSHVRHASLASRAGLRRGDSIVSIDDEPVFALAQARSLLRGAVGVVAHLTIRRGGRERQLIIPRERYVGE
ncbi:MAG: carboxypeptidase regulatory-like domain-containing protein, partial [Myxococcales bacterium]|nr:carboxypeptidase regulatory-like domain-containing protein [Myxococcales bacterium]